MKKLLSLMILVSACALFSQNLIASATVSLENDKIILSTENDSYLVSFNEEITDTNETEQKNPELLKIALLSIYEDIKDKLLYSNSRFIGITSDYPVFNHEDNNYRVRRSIIEVISVNDPKEIIISEFVIEIQNGAPKELTIMERFALAQENPHVSIPLNAKVTPYEIVFPSN